MGEQTVALQALDRTPAAAEARRRLGEALGAEVPAPDGDGIVEVVVEAEDREAAVQRVWDAVAASGADDHLAFAEHSGVPEHWRSRPGEQPGAGG